MKRLNKTKLDSFMKKGASIIDIRSPVDFRDGNIKNSKNIPAKQFIKAFVSLDKTKSILLVVNDMPDTDIDMIDKYAHMLGHDKLWVGTYRDLRDA